MLILPSPRACTTAGRHESLYVVIERGAGFTALGLVGFWLTA
jgi:hypothetical protein